MESKIYQYHNFKNQSWPPRTYSFCQCDIKHLRDPTNGLLWFVKQCTKCSICNQNINEDRISNVLTGYVPNSNGEVYGFCGGCNCFRKRDEVYTCTEKTEIPPDRYIIRKNCNYVLKPDYINKPILQKYPIAEHYCRPCHSDT